MHTHIEPLSVVREASKLEDVDERAVITDVVRTLIGRATGAAAPARNGGRPCRRPAHRLPRRRHRPARGPRPRLRDRGRGHPPRPHGRGRHRPHRAPLKQTACPLGSAVGAGRRTQKAHRRRRTPSGARSAVGPLRPPSRSANPQSPSEKCLAPSCLGEPSEPQGLARWFTSRERRGPCPACPLRRVSCRRGSAGRARSAGRRLPGSGSRPGRRRRRSRRRARDAR